MVPFVSAHLVKVTQKDLKIILSEANPLTSSLSQIAQQSIEQLCKPIIIDIRYIIPLKFAVYEIGSGMGPVVFVYFPQDQDKSDCAEEE